MRRPRFIAEQARHAKGPIGRLIAFIMSRETWGENKRAIEALDIRESDHILDIGCGHGRGLAELAALAPKGRVVGADHSELMVEVALKRNRELVKTHRVEVATASIDALPFSDETFDKAICVHVVYFWKDLDGAFRNVARVLKSGGRLALVFRTDADEAAVRAFPAEVYHFPSLTSVSAALRGAGLAVSQIYEPSSKDRNRPMLLVATKASEAAALVSNAAI